MRHSHTAVLTLITLTLASCGSGSTVEPPLDPVIVAKPHNISLGFYNLQLLGTPLDNSTLNGSPLKIEQVSAGVVSFDDPRFFLSRFRVTNLSKITINYLTLLPSTTTSADSSATTTIGDTPFTLMKYSDGSDASEQAKNLSVGTAGVKDQYPASVRPDPYATPFVQDLDISDIAVQAPAGLKINTIQPKGWRLERPLAAGESAEITIGSFFPSANVNTTQRFPSTYSMSIVAVDGPTPQDNPFRVKVDLSQALQGTEYSFPNWRPNGEALYITPLFNSTGQRMITLTHLEADGTAAFNLPGKTAMESELEPIDDSPIPDCISNINTVDFSNGKVTEIDIIMAEDFTVFRGLSVGLNPKVAATATTKSQVRLVYYNRDLTGTIDTLCRKPTGDIRYISVYSAKAGWNIVTSSYIQTNSLTEKQSTINPVNATQVWTLSPTGRGGAQSPRY